VRQINRMMPAPPVAPSTKACPYCVSVIPINATRCPNCTSELKEAA
jgi:large conductance mechanosensitive channel